MGERSAFMTVDPIQVHQDDVPWGDYSQYYPDDMMRTMRAKRLIGPGGAIPHDEVLLGVLEIDPGAAYPLHRHAAPELYYVLSGRAECRFGERRFWARQGAAIHTRPGVPHSFRNPGPDAFVALGLWWAPGGDRETLRCALDLMSDDA